MSKLTITVCDMCEGQEPLTQPYHVATDTVVLVLCPDHAQRWKNLATAGTKRQVTPAQTSAEAATAPASPRRAAGGRLSAAAYAGMAAAMAAMALALLLAPSLVGSRCTVSSKCLLPASSLLPTSSAASAPLDHPSPTSMSRPHCPHPHFTDLSPLGRWQKACSARARATRWMHRSPSSCRRASALAPLCLCPATSALLHVRRCLPHGMPC